ncbi:hypothetical protein CF319_g6655 [Tilletia indica]|nr:hypothetical protein CF319_g6655 [Tilletia indica]
MTRQLQTLIDICMFMRLHRARSFLASTSPEEEAAFQQLANSFHVDTISIFQDDNEGPANDKNEKKRQTLLAQLSCIGAKGLGIASILGSSCFLVFLMLSKQMSTQGRIRSTTNPTLAALSYLLRGGRPQLEGLPPDERQRAEAVIFGAQVILPRALNYFLAAAARGFDNRATHNPVTALYITDTKPSVASPIESPPDTMPLPQPLLVRRTSAGDNLPALTFGLMSGYGQDRQPLLLPAPWLLTTGYHHFKEQSVEARNKKDLSHVFPGPVSGFDPLYPVLPNQTNVSFEAEYEHAVLLAPAYSAHFGLRENNAGMIAIMDSVKRGSLLTGDIPPVPSHYNLRLRHTEIQLTRGGDQATLPAATIGPIEIDEEDEDDSLERVVDDE